MIERTYLLEWREFAPWQLESQVEQDLVLSRALLEIFSDDFLKNEVALRGGTALNKLFLKKNIRYSEDIDLVRVNPGPARKIFARMEERLDPWLGKPSTNQKKESIVWKYRFKSHSEPISNLRLKIEMNTQESDSVLGSIEKDFHIDSRWHKGSAKIKTFKIEELLGTKLRALYQRKKGRDLLDFLYAFEEIKSLDINLIVQIFQDYVGRAGKNISRAQFEANLFEKIKDENFLSDTGSLVVPNTKYDARAAYQQVLEKLIYIIPGEPWKGYPENKKDNE